MTKHVFLGLGLLLPSLILARNESKPADADFAERARKLGEQERLKVEPVVLTPAKPLRSGQKPSHTNIVATVFWLGKDARTAWDPEWGRHYGGADEPERSQRRNFIPTAFVPRLNPFYCALPYNDVMKGQFKPEAPLVIPWFKAAYKEPGRSVCQSRWVEIRKGNRAAYAQWEDCGPFVSNHFQYVFGTERPRPNANHGSGLNVSPAVRDYLGLSSTDVTDWQFVEVRDVPPGPWRDYGDNNHFVQSRRKTTIQAPDFRSF